MTLCENNSLRLQDTPHREIAMLQSNQSLSVDTVRDVIKRLSEEPSLQFVFFESDLPNSNAQSDDYAALLEQYLKKMAAYAHRILFVFQASHAPAKGWTGPAALQYRSKLFQSMGEKMQSAFSRTFFFLPDQVHVGDWIRDPDDCGSDDSEFFSSVALIFSEEYKNRSGYFLRLNQYSVLQKHFLEHNPANEARNSAVNVWLPNIRNVPIDVLLRIREDHQDSFSRYQFALGQFMSNSRAMDSEQKLNELFAKVDYETRQYSEKLKAISRSSALRTYQMIVGASIAGLAFSVDSEVAKLITSFVGAYQGKEYLSAIFQNAERRSDLRSSDFFIPWLLNEKNEKHWCPLVRRFANRNDA